MPLNFSKYQAPAFAKKNYVACILSEIMAKIVAVHAMEVYRRVAVQIQSFLT